MDVNIQTHLQRIQNNILLLNEAANFEPILEEIEIDFLQLLELCKLFLLSERDTYYGYVLMSMRFQTNFFSPTIAGILLDEFPPVLEANPLLLCAFHLKEILFILCHEIDHVILNHPAEMLRLGKDDPDLLQKFNLAADAAVNDAIQYEIKKKNYKFLQSPTGLITSAVLGEMFAIPSIRPLENYLYYYMLIKDKMNPEANEASQPQRMLKKSSQDIAKKSEEQKETKPIHPGNYDSLLDHNWHVADEIEQAQSAARELVNASYGIMSPDTRSRMSGQFLQAVEILNVGPKLSWQQILKRYIGSISDEKRKTKTRLNRRQPHRFDLSGTQDDKLLKIIVAIDTSASVDDSMVSSILTEIFAILAKRKHHVTILECDARVQRVYRVKHPSDIQKKIAGRGGTAFTPAIEYINQDKYYRDALLIYFTDGFGEENIPKPRTYRNLWVVFENAKNLSLKEPYGLVISLDE